MIPFAKILKYGNKLPGLPTIVDVKHSYGSNITTYILRSNGELWGGGYNGEGQLGLGNRNDTYRKTCVKLKDGVKLISHYNNLAMIYTEDNTLMIAGFDYRISSPTVDTNYRSSWFDISYRFSGIDLTQIKEIGSTRMNAYVLLNNGNMYSIGFFRVLGGTQTSGGNYTNIPTLCGTDVKSMQCTEEVCTFWKNDGTMWGFGNNGYARVYVLDVSSPSSTTDASYVNPAVQMFMTTDTTNMIGWYGGANNTLVFKSNASSTVGCGSPYYGTLGAGYDTSGATGYLSTSPNMTVQLPQPCAKLLKVNPNSMQRVYQGTDGFYYMIGYNPNGELGIGISKGTGNDYAITQWTKNTVLPVSNESVRGFSYGYFVSYMFTDTEIYICGRTQYGISTQYDSVVSSPIFLKYDNLPFYGA